MLLANETPTPATYNVVVHYVFENNEIVADSYTASLAAGSSFSATVTFPVVQGYLPYVGEAAETSSSIELNYTNIQEDHTITVVYKPTNVDYTVIHYQQNVDNDQYTEVGRETRQGLTNSPVPEVAWDKDDDTENNPEGFYSLLYEKPAIAADGSTVVEVYYDRIYSLMLFDLDGGYGVEPIYARYGTPIGNVGTPTKAGYTFKRWSEDGTIVDLPDEMPAGNKTYKALWQPDNTAKVTIVFWGENADDEEYSYLDSAEVNVKPGTEFTYSEDGLLICGQEEHTHDDTCYTCGQSSHTHSTGCYAGVGDRASSGSTGKPRNPAEGQVYKGTFNTYIYIKGTWYYYTGSTASGSIAPTICGKTESTHTHTDACLGCGKTEHTHTSSCYVGGAGLDAGLWKFVRSDTVTVAADGSSVVNVYYDRVEYTVNFYTRGNSPSEYTDLRITAKWGASILDQWPTYNSSSSWYVSTSGNTWQNSIQVMPVGGAKFYGPKTGDSSYTAYYYVEALPGDTDTITHNGVTYKLHHTDVSVSSGNVTDEERYEIKGFTYKEGTANGQSFNNAKFYYTRNSYYLTFSDGFNEVSRIRLSIRLP
jgi:uncharacterized repeat protein (TIGR02543 family)